MKILKLVKLKAGKPTFQDQQTNEPEELKMCDEVINLDELKLKMKRQIVK